MANARFCNKIVQSFTQAFGGGIKPNITRVQRDGWRCGYFSSFWYIYVHFLLKEGQSSFMANSWTNPEIPPEGWERFIHLLLQARDVTPDKYGYPLSLGLDVDFKESLDTGVIFMQRMCNRLQEYIDAASNRN